MVPKLTFNFFNLLSPIKCVLFIYEVFRCSQSMPILIMIYGFSMDACGSRILKLYHNFCAKHKFELFTCIYNNNNIISIVNYRSFILSICLIIFSTHLIVLIYVLICLTFVLIGCKLLVPQFSCCKMDWQGQKLAEHLMQLLLVVFAIVAFITGYVLGSFRTMLLTYAGGVVLTSLITIPNWPFFNRHPLQWLDPSEAEKHPKPQPVVSGPKKKSSKK